MENKHSRQFNAVLDTLRKEEFVFTESQEDDSCLVQLAGKYALYPIIIRHIPPLRLLYFGVYPYLKVPSPERIGAVSEGIARANFGLYLAKFCLTEENAILIEISLPLGRRLPDRATVIEILSTLVLAADACYPVFSKLIWSDCNASEALDEFLRDRREEGEDEESDEQDGEGDEEEGEAYSPEDGNFLEEV